MFTYWQANEMEPYIIGLTNDIERRVAEHKNKIYQGFTAKYNVRKITSF